MPPNSVSLRNEHLEAMREHVRACVPGEACGLLGGRDGRVEVVLAVANASPKVARFRMDPQGQLRAMLEIEAAGMELLAIYHSHPQGPEGPSAIDLAEAAYPEAAHLIWFPAAGGWCCQAFAIASGRAWPIPVRVDG
jgi:proteasome lid subunit RPN8/RPN11